MMAIDPFRLRAVKFAATQCMASNEQVVCVDGCSNFLYFGTTHGNIVRLELQEHEDTEVRDVMQLPTKSAITQLLAASAVECLIVVSASKIFYVDINSLQILSAGVSSSVICIALNTNPVTEDPFALHIAVATSNRMILVCEKSERNSFVRQRITTDDNVIAICYSKNCICYATQNEYFVYNINGNVTLSLFPYDIATTTPLIVNIDTEEFLVSGMQGLAIFATSAGVSSRPPLFWGADRIVSTAYHSPYIFALNSSSLIVFKCNEASEVHRMSVVEGSIVSNVTGRVVLCVKNQISLIEEISWFDRAEALLTQSCIDDALKLAEESVLSASYDEAEILRLNRLKQKAALIYFRDEQFEKCSDMATSAEVDPRELIFHYGHLELPLVPFQVSDFNTAAVGEVDTTSERHLGFLQKYLLRVRNLHWTRAYKRDLDTALVCLLSRHGGLLEEKSLSELSCSLHDCKEWMRARNCLRFYVSVAFECDNMEDAFETCHELSDIGRFDADLHQLCLRNFTRIMDVKILLHSLEFLLRFDAASTVRSLESVPIQVDPREIVKYLEPYRDEHIIYLQRMRPLQIAELDTKLAILYIEEISRLLLNEGNDNIQKIKQYRTSLRHLFFESHYMEKVKVAEKMKGSPAFAVETIILKGKDSASEECLETLLNEYREFDAAELYCFYMNAHNKRLFRILLKSYLKIVATQPEFKSRIVNMLQSMNEPGDELEIIAEFPDDWPLQTLSSFASKALSAYDYRLHCDKLRTAALSVALRHLTSELREGASTKVSIDDHTRCAVCGNLIGNEEVAVYPHSNTLAHRSCTNCSHLCPEMDTAG